MDSSFLRFRQNKKKIVTKFAKFRTYFTKDFFWFDDFFKPDFFQKGAQNGFQKEFLSEKKFWEPQEELFWKSHKVSNRVSLKIFWEKKKNVGAGGGDVPPSALVKRSGAARAAIGIHELVFFFKKVY